jgi:hypothetical protein
MEQVLLIQKPTPQDIARSFDTEGFRLAEGLLLLLRNDVAGHFISLMPVSCRSLAAGLDN